MVRSVLPVVFALIVGAITLLALGKNPLVFYGATGAMAGLFDIPKEWRKRCANTTDASLPGGHFFIGHSESLNDISTAVEQLAPSIYRKP